LTTEEELREALEGERKPLKSIVLPENSNDIDQGGTAKEEKIGDKNLDQEKKISKSSIPHRKR
jgi:hypothetical protein